ncbi:hypothetical protein ABT120_56100 [Nonomuraea angiospora]|uniref:hypothetical protein n=1 Tax=Nonomuraea angiospora TaxID=46172 RepID=UPI00331F398C
MPAARPPEQALPPGLIPKPADPQLAAHLDQVMIEHAARFGWQDAQVEKVRQAVRALLGLLNDSTNVIKASEVAVLMRFDLPVRPVLEVLEAAGLLEDDRVPTIDTWFAGKITVLPAVMAAEMRVWFDVMRHGSVTHPRSKPRSPDTITVRVRSALPALQAWAAAGHSSLRDISPADVQAVLPTSGSPRALVGAALRSIFTVLKARRMTFTNPIAKISTGRPETRLPLPVEVGILRQILDSTDPARAALGALLAFHALRCGQICHLRLTDLRDGRLYLDQRAIPLAPPVRERLTAYLAYRNARWPTTANPHVFLSIRTAVRLTPVSTEWVSRKLGVPAQMIREDRILDEAHASDGDPRRLGDLFGLSIKGATRYTATVDHPSFTDLDKPAPQ